MTSSNIVFLSDRQCKHPVVAPRKPQTPRQYFKRVYDDLTRVEYAYLSAVIGSMRKNSNSVEMTQQEIAQASKYCVRSVKQAQQSLIDKGIIRIIQQQKTDRKNRRRKSGRPPHTIELVMEG